MNAITRIVLFLVLNFSALYAGILFTGPGVNSDWYTSLEQAPWTPPGWVFGFAWTSIMICYALYLGALLKATPNRFKFWMIYGLQWSLNVLWNPLFFYYHKINLALIVIVMLLVVVAFSFISFRKYVHLMNFLLLPYVLWLIVATSLNAYICLNN